MDNLFRRLSHRPGSRSPQGHPPPLPPHRPTGHGSPTFDSQPAPHWNPQNTHNRNQSVHAAPAPPSVGWPPSPSFSGATQVQGLSRPGNSDSHPHRDNWTGGFRQQGNFNSPGTGNQPIARSNSISYAPHDSPTSEERDEALSWFYTIDQNNDGKLSHEELHYALLANGYRPFSVITVKYLVSVFDQNLDGVIGKDEFVHLWKYLNQWIRMFDSFDRDGNGKISITELDGALRHYSVHVARDVLEMVMKKYASAPAAHTQHRQPDPGPQMDLDHFVCACVSVQKMCKLYDDCSADGRPRISKNAFLRAILALP
ncbi:hypothetical protein BJV77DRAFT_538943 [Russula vinacea]|nr:hypothetical protein BJV77DRAFT_538943 [Russula vinacea]